LNQHKYLWAWIFKALFSEKVIKKQFKTLKALMQVLWCEKKLEALHVRYLKQYEKL